MTKKGFAKHEAVGVSSAKLGQLLQGQDADWIYSFFYMRSTRMQSSGNITLYPKSTMPLPLSSLNVGWLL
jgi:hypothetical protein